jgi:hypothetical protein
MDIQVPVDVTKWLRSVFASCNRRVSEKLSNAPNVPEPSLDLTFIEHLSQFASPITFGSKWTVRLDTHYLGGLRHFQNWEIADIGLLLFFRRGGKVIRSKVALLQSKRLYPNGESVKEEIAVDYEIGFARLADPEDVHVSLNLTHRYRFDGTSRYGALIAGDDQFKAIAEYTKKYGLSIYYLFYNPWCLPFIQNIPLKAYGQPKGECELGARVVPFRLVESLLKRKKAGHKPAISELKGLIRASGVIKDVSQGWRMEDFVADLLLQCVEGHRFQNIEEERIQNLFYRRNGPISAAIAISIELPD